MWDFAADSWEGTMGAQEFWDGVRELLDLFVCDTCEHHHKWRDENGDCDIMHGAEYAPTGPEYCLDKLAELLRTHTLAEPCQENNWRWTLEEKKQEDVQ
ncbi:MAG: hypothetical protein LUE27_11445 [Clostridia bacterium]|nr:hypothetical protein [Clostridia bacterium]